MELHLPQGRSGVLPSQHLERALDAGAISATEDVPQRHIQPASLDLRLGKVAHRLRCSFLPGTRAVEEGLEEFSLYEMSLENGAVLEVGLPYLIPLQERLHLPQSIKARANPKSSTGRADVFTRVVTDHSARFDDIRAGYSGRLYLEVVPLSFPVRVQTGLTLNQLRLSVGNSRLTDQEIRDEHAKGPLLKVKGKTVDPRQLEVASGLFLSLNLLGKGIGWQARGSAPLLDMTQVRSSDRDAFWDPVRRSSKTGIVLEPKTFYLLMSQEAVTIPPHLAAEMAAYDPTSGELRTHYAGFFDPGFGYSENPANRGSTAALEVRAHDVAFQIEHRQYVCKLTFEPMLEEPKVLYGDSGFGSNYQGQTETLGKHFRVGSTADVEPRPTATPAAQPTLLDDQ